MTDKEIKLYEEMNAKIADIIAIAGDPSSLYASAYIKDLRAENARLKADNTKLINEADDNAALAIKQKLRADKLEEQIESIRKETAKEILEYWLDDWRHGQGIEDFSYLCEKYGVEVRQ